MAARSNVSPLDILDVCEVKDGLVIHVENKLTGTSAYVAYPGATQQDLDSGKIFKRGVWSANFTDDDVGFQLALTVLKVYQEIKCVNHDKPSGESELRSRKRS